ncbi:MAG TPA: relaxase/mobilization nuclease domain-containing protein [Panacibacter sp.]|nr:relaxase/mobilization nuclease domain-containing protein [Panacibacter sp.]HNP47035.1 relaxase/mobilization nuclease domain-containing protein [Panacibacter sp.]
MILKSLSRKSVNSSAQLVAYLLRYSLREKSHVKDKENAELIHRENLRSRTIAGYIREFNENEANRLYKRKDSVKLYHNIISFAPDDKNLITDLMLKDIVKKFIELRGKNNIYLAVRHQETLHKHLHIIVSGVQLNGYSSRVSKQQFKHIKIELDKYQKEKYPQLVHSLVNHDKKTHRSKTELIEQIKTSRQTEKQKLVATLEKIYSQATSTEDFLDKIKEQKLDVYKRNSAPQGIIIDGQKFRFSRLGYDAQKIKELNDKVSADEQNILALKELRSGKKRTLKKEELPEVKKLSQEQTIPEEKLLHELASLRKRPIIRNNEQPGKEADSNDLEHTGEGTNQRLRIARDADQEMPNLFSFIEGEAVMPGH